MGQVLIVEGKDGIMLSMLCELRNLPPPVGYETPEKYMQRKTGFVKSSGGYEKALKDFREYLDKPDYERIGLVVDADENGPAARCQSIENLIKERFSEWTGRCAPSPGGVIIQEENLPVIGVWIMPDNQRNGYLEHFVAELIPEGDALWPYAQTVVGQLPECRFPAARDQKALLHTWLAWQETPGLPFGTALSSGILTPESPLADRFIEWFKGVFELSVIHP